MGFLMGAYKPFPLTWDVLILVYMCHCKNHTYIVIDFGVEELFGDYILKSVQYHLGHYARMKVNCLSF